MIELVSQLTLFFCIKKYVYSQIHILHKLVHCDYNKFLLYPNNNILFDFCQLFSVKFTKYLLIKLFASYLSFLIVCNYINKKLTSVLWRVDVSFFEYTRQNHVCGFVISYNYDTWIMYKSQWIIILPLLSFVD